MTWPIQAKKDASQSPIQKSFKVRLLREAILKVYQAKLNSSILPSPNPGLQMFFDSCIEGLQILTHWRFWVVVLGAGIVAFVPTLIFGAGIAMTNSEGTAAAAGCMSALLMSAWHLLVITGTLLLLIPLMVFRRDMIDFDLVTTIPFWSIVKICLVGLISGILVGIIPLIGSFPSIPSFAQSSAIIGIVISIASDGQAVVWPGILHSLGFAVGGGILSIFIFCALAIPFYALAIPIVALTKGEEDFQILLGQPLGLIPALVPACLYAGWLRVANGW